MTAMSEQVRARPSTEAVETTAVRFFRAVQFFIELFAAALVLVEVAVLFAGVVARYVLHAPLVWSDELASAIFLWLVMIGALIALVRNQHMRMTAFVSGASEGVQVYLEVIATLVTLVFLSTITISGYEFTVEESFITTPAMSISNSWRVAAIPVGGALMVAFTLFRLFMLPNRRGTIFTSVLAAAIIVGLIYASPFLQSLGNINLIIFFVGVVGVGVCAGIPIAFTFGLAMVGYLALSTQVPLMVVVGRMDEGMGHLILLAVPLFVLLGYLIAMTGMAAAMVQFLGNLLGQVRGGLSYVLVGAMYLVSGISGSKTADMAAIAPALFPEMKARGANSGELVALLAATGAQTETIPPSLVLITISSATGVSIAALFIGGLLPGAILGLMLCGLVWFRNRNEDLSSIRHVSWRKILSSFVFALPALALPFIIRTAVVEGIATATEVSTIGIIYSLAVGLLLYRKFNWRAVFPMLVNTAALSGAIMFIIGAATAMAWGLTQSGFAQALASAMSTMPGGRTTFIIASIFAFIALGSLLEGIPAIVLFGPLLFPIARKMGVHEVHYSMIVTLSMAIGLFSPPFGVGYYAACAISGVNPNEGIRPILGYMLMLLLGIAIVAAFPWISIGFL
jgi:tripartite ATP-independent transporter DctM subunit